MTTIYNQTFFLSKDIRVFPCAYRGYYSEGDNSQAIVFDPESRSTTEANFVNTFSKLSNTKTSYVVSWDAENKTLKCVIGGYYFEIYNYTPTATDLLCIKLIDQSLASNTTYDKSRTTSILSSFVSDEYYLDVLPEGQENYIFTGLCIKDSSSTDNLDGVSYSLKPFKADATGNVILDVSKLSITAILDAGEGSYSIRVIEDIKDGINNTTIASGNYASAFGKRTKAEGNSSFTEGVQTVASGEGSHAEGNETKASGYTSHAEGNETIASGYTSHAEGNETKAFGNYSHAEGCGSIASTSVIFTCIRSHDVTYSSNTSSSVGTVWYNSTDNIYARVTSIVYNNEDSTYTYTFDKNLATTIDTNDSVNVYRVYGIAYANYSHTEGYNNIASRDYSHAEGNTTAAKGQSSHAEGNETEASGNYSHAENNTTKAKGIGSHAEGFKTEAEGNYSHAEGSNTIAKGNNSHVGGLGTIAEHNNQTVIGTYNDNIEGTLFEVGNGTKENVVDDKGDITAKNRSNALEIKSDETNIRTATTKIIPNNTNARVVVTDTETTLSSTEKINLETTNVNIKSSETLTAAAPTSTIIKTSTLDIQNNAENSKVKIEDTKVTIKLPTNLNNTLTVADEKNTTLGGALEVKGATTLKGTLIVNSTTQLNNSLTVAEGKNTALGGTLEVDGATTLNNNLTVAEGKKTTLGGELEVGGVTTLNNTLTVAEEKKTTLGGELEVGGATQLNDNLTVGTTEENGSKATTLNGTLQVTGNTTLGGTLEVNKNVTFKRTGNETDALILRIGSEQEGLKGALNIYGNGTTTVFSVNSDGKTAISDTLTVDGATNFNNTLTVADEKNTTLGGALEVKGATTLKSNLTIAGELTGVTDLVMTGDLTGVTDLVMTGDLTGVNNLEASGEIQALSFNATSDCRKKCNIEDYRCEKSILDLPIKKFEYINDDSHSKYIGCIAQDLQEICPEIVHTDKDGYLSIAESKLVYLLLQEVKELKEQVENLKK